MGNDGCADVSPIKPLRSCKYPVDNTRNSIPVHTLDAPDHAGGWSVDASVMIPAWDRRGLERLVRYCARPALSQEHLGRVSDEMLVYSLGT